MQYEQNNKVDVYWYKTIANLPAVARKISRERHVKVVKKPITHVTILRDSLGRL
jgi:hypothetical protein